MTLENTIPRTFNPRGYILGGIFLLISLFSHLFQTTNEYLPVFWVTTTSLLLLVATSFISLVKHSHKTRINKMDILVSLYLCYGSIRWFFTGDIPHDPVIPCEWLGLTCIYILARNLDDKGFQHILLFILLSGVIQATGGILQYTGILTSLHNVFPITGSFHNPGPLGGYLAIITACGFYAWHEREFTVRYKKIIFPIILLTLLTALLFTDSRAAWLAVTVSFLVLLCQKLKFPPSYRTLFQIAIILVITSFIITLYFYKQGSADMRLLTWASGILMFWDSPLLGYGIGNFSTKYMLYQAEFLNTQSNGTFALIADNNILAFNEYIRLLCEQGIIGFILFSLIIFSGMKECHNFKKRIALGELGCLGIFAFFSYPASVLSIKLFIPLFLGILGQKGIATFEFTLNTKRLIPVTTVLLVGLYFNLTTHLTYHKAFHDLDSNKFSRQPFSLKGNTQYIHMLHNKTYLYRLSEQLIRGNQPEHALTVKKQLARLAPTSSLLCDIGILHLQKGITDIADSLFIKAHQMTPHHITPVYCSFLVARQNNNTIRGQQLAEKIINMPMRKINNIVLKARHEAKEYTKNQLPIQI